MIDGLVRLCCQGSNELEVPIARFVPPLWTTLDLGILITQKDAPDDIYADPPMT
jgi:hypothetical protein